MYHGFTDTDGVISPVEVPGSTSNGISNTGTLVGYSGNAAGTVYQGWLQARGQLTFLNNPDAGSGGALPLGISENGKTVCGFCFDANSVQHGFVATVSP